MRLHYLQHVSFEGIDAIGEWARERGCPVSGTELFEPAALPSLDALDLLVVMGGPMNIYEHEAHPWLAAEKAFIRDAIASGKAALGICLGAQLLADVLGGAVTKNPQKEIGWFPVQLTEAARTVPVFDAFPGEFPAFHWHGDTFSIPDGAVHAASSAGCAGQAFAAEGGRVVGLQFHLEVTPAGLRGMVENARQQVIVSRDEPWVQSPRQFLAADAPGADYGLCRQLLFALLDRMVQTVAA